jgi:tryptophanyl-tRNA synthetase
MRCTGLKRYDVAATLLALGLDKDKIIFFRQADIPEIFELTWILSCFTAKGLLNRAQAYKAAVDENLAAGKQVDVDINAFRVTGYELRVARCGLRVPGCGFRLSENRCQITENLFCSSLLLKSSS